MMNTEMLLKHAVHENLATTIHINKKMHVYVKEPISSQRRILVYDLVM